jgi:hypothetical protein
MRRRSYFFAAGILACLVCGVAGVVIAMVRHEPHWYVTAAAPPGAERTKASNEFFESFWVTVDLIRNEREWGGKFPAPQVNAYFQERLFDDLKLDPNQLPGQIREPRVAFEQDRLRFGFRYGKGVWSTIISMTLKVWVSRDESTAVVLELENFEAGALSVSSQSVLDEISRLLREKDIEINWYRHNGHPVAVVRFQANQQRSTIQLTAIQVKDDLLMIQGRNNDPALGPFPQAGGAAPAGN